jgi:hypothetical protein
MRFMPNSRRIGVGRFQIEIQLHVVAQGHELPHRVGSLPERQDVLPELGRQLVRVVDDRRNGAVPVQQLHGLLRADSVDAGDIIDAVAHQHLGLDRLVRAVALFFDHGRDVDDAVLAGVVHSHVIAEQLIEVLVATDEKDVQRVAGESSGQRGHDVVCLVTGLPQDGHADGPQDGDDPIGLGRQVFRRRLAPGLVGFVDLHAKYGFVADVHRHHDVIRPAVTKQPQQHLHEDVNRPGRLSRRRGQGPKGREVGAIYLGVAVDEIERLRSHAGDCRRHPGILRANGDWTRMADVTGVITTALDRRGGGDSRTACPTAAARGAK